MKDDHKNEKEIATKEGLNEKKLFNIIVFSVCFVLFISLVLYLLRPKQPTKTNSPDVRSIPQEEVGDYLDKFNEKFGLKEKWLKEQDGYIDDRLDTRLPKEIKQDVIQDNIDYVEVTDYCGPDSVTKPFVTVRDYDEDNEDIEMMIVIDGYARYLRGKDYGFIRVETNKVNSIKALQKAYSIGGQTILGIIKVGETTFDVYTIEDHPTFDTVCLLEKIEDETTTEETTENIEETTLSFWEQIYEIGLKKAKEKKKRELEPISPENIYEEEILEPKPVDKKQKDED